MSSNSENIYKNLLILIQEILFMFSVFLKLKLCHFEEKNSFIRIPFYFSFQKNVPQLIPSGQFEPEVRGNNSIIPVSSRYPIRAQEQSHARLPLARYHQKNLTIASPINPAESEPINNKLPIRACDPNERETTGEKPRGSDFIGKEP